MKKATDMLVLLQKNSLDVLNPFESVSETPRPHFDNCHSRTTYHFIRYTKEQKSNHTETISQIQNTGNYRKEPSVSTNKL